MKPLQLLTLLRTISNDTIRACEIGEYTENAIFNIHFQKLMNVNNAVKYNSELNKKVKLKYFQEINKLYLTPTRLKTYGGMAHELKQKVATLSSAIDFVKR